MKIDINKILALPSNKAFSKYGAQMGRRNQNQGSPERLHLQHINFVDGDYDAGGAYWGGAGNPIYCAFSPNNTKNETPIKIFVRAKNRQEAKQIVLDEFDCDGWTFFK